MPMIETLGAVFAASLIGSLHCAGMCGGLVVFCCGGEQGGVSRAWPVHVSYHGARLVAYVAAGAVVGLLGSAIDDGGRLVGWQQTAAYLAAAVLILMGVAMLAKLAGVRIPRGRLPGPLRRLIERVYTRAASQQPWVRGAMVGLMSPMLPCGWLWAFLAVAAAAGGVLGGMAVMGVFWAGTVPILLVIGVGTHRLAPAIRRLVPATMGVALVAVGILTALTRVPLASAAVSAAGHVDAVNCDRAVECVEELERGGLPCCGDAQ